MLGPDGPGLDPLGQRRIRDVVERRPTHEEEPARGCEALGLEQRSVTGFALVGEAADPVRQAAVLAVRHAFRHPTQVLVEHRPADPTPTECGIDVPVQVVGRPSAS